MSEIARVSAVGPDADVAATPIVQFEAFFEAEKRQLYRALCLVTRNRHEAEDLTQEAFIRVLERWDRVVGVDDPHGYLYRTAMNVFRRHYGRALRANRETLDASRPHRRRDRRESTSAMRRSVHLRVCRLANEPRWSCIQTARVHVRGGSPDARYPGLDCFACTPPAHTQPLKETSPRG